jgi:HD-like signal output (HDOD) protein
LHDIGLALYMTIDEVSLIELLALRGAPGDSLESIERSYLGISHVEAGLALCHAWRLPEVVSTAVAGHHDPERAPAGPLRVVAQLVHVADYLCAAQGLGDFGEQRPAALNPKITSELGLAESHFPALLRSVGETARRLNMFEI